MVCLHIAHLITWLLTNFSLALSKAFLWPNCKRFHHHHSPASLHSLPQGVVFLWYSPCQMLKQCVRSKHQCVLQKRFSSLWNFSCIAKIFASVEKSAFMTNSYWIFLYYLIWLSPSFFLKISPGWLLKFSKIDYSVKNSKIVTYMWDRLDMLAMVLGTVPDNRLPLRSLHNTRCAN